MKLPLWRIAEFVSAKGEDDQEAVAIGFSIDSRTLNAGGLFIGIAGEHFDGHEYVEAAMEKGAVGAVVQAEKAQADKNVAGDPLRLLRVEDTVKALQSLGAAARRLWGKPLLAVTGSAGKTTNKEIPAHILAPRFPGMKNTRNLNKHICPPPPFLKLGA